MRCNILPESGFYDFAASKTSGTDSHTPSGTIDFRTDFYKIRPEFTFRFVVCMADVIADKSFFSANLALS